MKNVKIVLIALLALISSSCLEAKKKRGTVTYTTPSGQLVTSSMTYRQYRYQYRNNPQYPGATYRTKHGKVKH